MAEEGQPREKVKVNRRRSPRLMASHTLDQGSEVMAEEQEGSQNMVSDDRVKAIASVDANEVDPDLDLDARNKSSEESRTGTKRKATEEMTVSTEMSSSEEAMSTETTPEESPQGYNCGCPVVQIHRKDCPRPQFCDGDEVVDPDILEYRREKKKKLHHTPRNLLRTVQNNGMFAKIRKLQQLEQYWTDQLADAGMPTGSDCII